ncbi:MAG: phosphoglycerate kinase, partial [Christensenellaceae bacterium]
MKKTIKDVVVDSKRVLVRVDFNVPLGEGGDVADETRIVAALPTIQYLIDHNAKVVLCSHLGRPKGEVKPEFSLAPVAKRLARMINTDLSFVSECVGPEVEKAVNDLKDGEVILLENLRFHNEETKNDPEFAKKLAALCDIYVNDAFGTAHRAHASTEGITHYVDECVAGFLMEKEIAFLGDALENPARPFVTVLGGAKIADKIPVIENLFNKVDCLIIG